MFDVQTESMYHQQQAMLQQGADGDTSFMNPLSKVARKMNLWEWYTTFQFESLRPHLPDDWERLMDSLSEQGSSWSEYTPRGATDALVPDYVYHSLGVSLGRTAGPEVAISAGYGKSGGGNAGGTDGDGQQRAAGGNGHGWISKPMGHCYPLSMHPSDDPALGLLSRHDGEAALLEDEEDTADASLLVGPKYTVRLPYAVHIDAVTLEHRSFPLPPSSSLENEKRGGESAPRWVRVVGFPPCPTTTKDGMEEECGVRGFDISKPIDLGSFEYQRITVTGREDDYGGSSDDEDGENDPWSGRRRRSIQTFAVNGGKWKPSTLFVNDASEDSPKEKEDYAASADPTQCSADSMSCEAPAPEEEATASILSEPETEPEPVAAGQCTPPKDEDSLPSCSAATTSIDASLSEGSDSAPSQRRHVVEAVSFIIEENWGSSEFTCLYRVRVHGDAAVFE
mmetsp:Transcript_35457/g.57827  ORF Transcript_35457/g.57827 Transcript_35457/m.57827 type:complete len:452 (-) Transcript_35457:87-1442(-)